MSNLRGGDTIGGYPIPGMFGTNGKIAKFNGSLITDSIISDNGNNIGISVTNPTARFHQFSGGFRLQGFTNAATWAVPTAVANGVTGSTTITYYIFPKDVNGNRGRGMTATVTNANATLSATNSVTISWTAITGAVSYDVLKGNYVTSLALNVTSTSVTDTGQATSAYAVPTNQDDTASMTIDGQLIFNNMGVLNTPSYRFVSSDGGGRFQELYNATGLFANQVYQITGEPALRFAKSAVDNLFSVYYAAAGTAGSPITWTSMLGLSPTGVLTSKNHTLDDGFGQLRIGSLTGLSTSVYSSGLAFNRSVRDGAIFDNTKPAYQVQMNQSASNRFEIQAYNSAGALVATPFIINSAGDMTFGNSVNLPANPTNSLAGQINSAGVVKFSTGGSAQGIYVNHIGVSGSWADNDTNIFAGGIYTYAGLKTKGDITMNVLNSGGNIGIRFNSNVNLSSDYGEIRYYDDNNSYSYWGETAENSALVISVGNDARNTNSDVVVLKAPAAVIIDSEGFRLPVLSGGDPGSPITGMIWLRSDL